MDMKTEEILKCLTVYFGSLENKRWCYEGLWLISQMVYEPIIQFL